MAWEEAPGTEPPDIRKSLPREDQEILGLRGPRAQARALVAQLRELRQLGIQLGKDDAAFLREYAGSDPQASAPIDDDNTHAKVLALMRAEGGIPSSAEPAWMAEKGARDPDKSTHSHQGFQTVAWDEDGWHHDTDDFADSHHSAPAEVVSEAVDRPSDPLEFAKQIEQELRQIWSEIKDSSAYGFRLKSWTKGTAAHRLLGLDDPFTLPEQTHLKRVPGYKAIGIGGSILHYFQLGKKDGEEFYLVIPSSDTSGFAVEELFNNRPGAGRNEKIKAVELAAIIKKNNDGEYELVRRGSLR